MNLSRRLPAWMIAKGAVRIGGGRCQSTMEKEGGEKRQPFHLIVLSSSSANIWALSARLNALRKSLMDRASFALERKL